MGNNQACSVCSRSDPATVPPKGKVTTNRQLIADRSSTSLIMEHGKLLTPAEEERKYGEEKSSHLSQRIPQSSGQVKSKMSANSRAFVQDMEVPDLPVLAKKHREISESFLPFGAINQDDNENSKLRTSELSDRHLSGHSKRKLASLEAAITKKQYELEQKSLITNTERVLTELTAERKRFREFVAAQQSWKGISSHFFPVQGGNTLQFKKILVHPFLISRFAPKEIVSMLKTKQTYATGSLSVAVSANCEGRIIEFVNSRSKSVFRAPLANSVQDIEPNLPTLQILSIEALFETFNSHVFKVIEAAGTLRQSPRASYVIKVPKAQLKPGVADLVLEGQLKLWLASKQFEYCWPIAEEIVQFNSQSLSGYAQIEEYGREEGIMPLKTWVTNDRTSPAMLDYFFFQLTDLAKRLLRDFGLINYGLSSSNLSIDESMNLKMHDLNLIDFVQNRSSPQSKKFERKEAILEFSSKIDQYQKYRIDAKREELEELGLSAVAMSPILHGGKFEGINSAREYFMSIQDDSSADAVVLKLIKEVLDSLNESPHEEQVEKMREAVASAISRKQTVDLLANTAQQYLVRAEVSGLLFGEGVCPSKRAVIATKILAVAKRQKETKLEVLAKLCLGEINSDLELLKECWTVSQTTEAYLLSSDLHNRLCLALAREFRKNGDRASLTKASFYLSSMATNDHPEYQVQNLMELAEIYQRQDNLEAACDTLQQILCLPAPNDFTHIDSQLKLGQILSKLGRQEEAERVFQSCIKKLGSQAHPVLEDQRSINSDDDLSPRLRYAPSKSPAAGGDPGALQRIGLFLRERLEFDKACDLFESVLTVKKRQFLLHNKHLWVNDARSASASEQLEEVLEDGDVGLFKDREFALLYNNLALCYQGLSQLDDAQEYLVLSIQCLEELDPPTLEAERQAASLELAESYLFLAELLRRQGEFQHAAQVLVKVVDLELELPNREESLVEVYKQMAEDFLAFFDYEQGIQAAELALDIEIKLHDEKVRHPEIQDTAIFIALAHQQAGDYVKSNESLAPLLELLDDEVCSLTEAKQLKILILAAQNLESLESFEDSIEYLQVALGLAQATEDKISINQRISSLNLQLGQYEAALEAQVTVHKLIKAQGRADQEGMLSQPSDSQSAAVLSIHHQETDQGIIAWFNVALIKFLIIEQQVQMGNERLDPSLIDEGLVIETKKTLEEVLPCLEEAGLQEREQAADMLVQLSKMIE